MYLDVAIDDLWCHAKGKPCHRPLSDVAKDLIEFVNARAVTEDGKRDLFRFYLEDLTKGTNG